MIAFKKVTEQLIQLLDTLEETFREEREVERDRNYFHYVKNETNDYFILLDEWEKAALALAEEGRTKVYPEQISTTIENMKTLIMHSYYQDVRKRRYMEIKKSCHYIFILSIEEMNE